MKRRYPPIHVRALTAAALAARHGTVSDAVAYHIISIKLERP